jgi:hypothetical protein
MSAPAAPAVPAGGDGAAAAPVGAAAPAAPAAPLAAAAGESDLDGGDENEVPDLVSDGSGSDYESDDAQWAAFNGDEAQLVVWPGPQQGGPVQGQPHLLAHFAQVGGLGLHGGGNLVRLAAPALDRPFRFFGPALSVRLTGTTGRSSQTCWHSCCPAAAGAAQAAPAGEQRRDESYRERAFSPRAC